MTGADFMATVSLMGKVGYASSRITHRYFNGVYFITARRQRVTPDRIVAQIALKPVESADGRYHPKGDHHTHAYHR